MKMVGLMDCNNFFVSCERLFRPDLRSKPVAVLSSNDGCIVARSQEVKDAGIPMGAPYFQVKDMCDKHNVTLFSSNLTLYRDISRRVMDALHEEFSSISVYSIDEAFVDIENEMTVDDIMSIRSRIVGKTGIPVSFGIAPTKTIAKIANSEAKKGIGVIWLMQSDAVSRYGSISCGSVWGIGRQMTKKLDSFGIRTVAEFLKKELRFVRAEFGVHGERLYHELNGIYAEMVSEELSPHASIMSTRSFAKDITLQSAIESAIGHHVASVAEKLREKGLLARSLTIICAPNRHGVYALRRGGKNVALEVPTNDTGELLKCAHRLFVDTYEDGVSYKKAGAVVSGLIPEGQSMPSLFDSLSEGNKESSIYMLVDKLNTRFGRGTVRPGIVHSQKSWASNSKLKSGEYTTKWTDIARVKAT